MTKPHKTLDELLNEPSYLAERAAEVARDDAAYEAGRAERAAEVARDDAAYEAGRAERAAKAERERLARVAAGYETEDGEPGPNADQDDSEDDFDEYDEDGGHNSICGEDE